MTLFTRLILWLVRLLAWPCAGRTLTGWPAAPREVTAANDATPMTGIAPRVGGTRMGDTANFIQQPGMSGLLQEQTK